MWAPDGVGILTLPSGRRVRGRGLRRPMPPGPVPTFAVHLLGKPPPPPEWESRWVAWPDLRLPRDPALFTEVLREAWERSATDRVEFACHGGTGRTGTALACLAVLDGVDPADAVRFVREHYRPRAVETPWQRRFVTQSRSWRS